MDDSARTEAASLPAAAAARPGGRDAAGGAPAGPVEATRPVEDVSDPALYINRELSWLDFNDRVLQLAEDERVPLLERVKFCAIYTTNLDEYYMVRVAGLHDQIDAGVENPSQDGLIPSQTIALIREKALEQGRRLADCFEGHLRPQLAENGIRIVGVDELDERQRQQLAGHFQRAIFPALTPLAVAPGRPFPYISNLSLSLAVLVRDPASGEVPRPCSRASRSRPRSSPASSRWRRRTDRARCWSRSRTSSPTTSTRCSRAWRSSTSTSSASPATPTSRSPTTPPTCCRRSRTSSAAGASARSCGSRSEPAARRSCGRS